MTSQELFNFKRGSIIEYQKLIIDKNKIENKLAKLLKNIYTLEDKISVYDSSSLDYRYITSKNKLYKLYNDKNKLTLKLDKVKSKLKEFI